MSRLTKTLSLIALILFVLACNTVTRPFNQAQEVVKTAQSLATAMPVETLKSFVTQVPVETLEAFPSIVPSLEAFTTGLPDFEGYFNPQGAPVSEWRGIPIMPQATTGQEFTDTDTYSFKVDASVEEVQNYYSTELDKLGWSSFFNMPGGANGSVQVFQKENNVLTITIADVNGSVLVIMTMA